MKRCLLLVFLLLSVGCDEPNGNAPTATTPTTPPVPAAPANPIPGSGASVPGVNTNPSVAAIPMPIPAAFPGTPSDSAGTSSDSSPVGGETVTSNSGLYKLWFPKTPQKVLSGEGNTATELLKYETTSPTVSFVFTEAQFPQPKTLDEMEKYIFQSPSAVWLPASPGYTQMRITFAGFPATELYLPPSGKDLYSAKAVLLVVDNSVVSVSVSGPMDGAASSYARMFLESFSRKQ